MHLVIPLSIDRSYRYEYSSGLLIIRHAKLADKLTTIQYAWTICITATRTDLDCNNMRTRTLPSYSLIAIDTNL